jgi:hypothetical protein
MIPIEEKAAKVACKLIYKPEDPVYIDESIRKYQGCPTIAITKGGRIYLGWYSGGTQEPHIDNFNLLVYSDDQGKSWSKPLLVIPSSRENLIHALDIQLWTAPDGRLFVFWVQNNVKPADLTDSDGKPIYTGHKVDGFIFNDRTHAEWVTICDNPDAEEPVFSEPRYLDKGFLRCKPLVLDNGAWLNFNYDQVSDRYGYSISYDNGKTYEHRYGAKKIPTPFDEGMAYQKYSGEIRMFARTSVGEIAESSSFDNAITWTEAKTSGIPNANTRLFISRTPSGRIVLVNNDHNKVRCRMTVYLSEDDGESWKYKRCIDERKSISYPDVDFYDGYIYLTYDRERSGAESAREILFAKFTEDDIINLENPIEIKIVSKP